MPVQILPNHVCEYLLVLQPHRLLQERIMMEKKLCQNLCFCPAAHNAGKFFCLCGGGQNNNQPNEFCGRMHSAVLWKIASLRRFCFTHYLFQREQQKYHTQANAGAARIKAPRNAFQQQPTSYPLPRTNPVAVLSKLAAVCTPAFYRRHFFANHLLLLKCSIGEAGFRQVALLPFINKPQKATQGNLFV